MDVDDLPRAQELLSGQLRTDWTLMMEQLVTRFHSAHRTMFTPLPLDYYWSAEETEWATDVMFRSRESLARIYPQLLRHGMTTFGSRDVLRFLGQAPVIRTNTRREIITTAKTRPEGTRLKHSLNRNSIKMYDKQELVLRVETTINDPRDMRVYAVSSPFMDFAIAIFARHCLAVRMSRRRPLNGKGQRSPAYSAYCVPTGLSKRLTRRTVTWLPR